MVSIWFDVYLMITVFVFGAIIGSFLNVVIYRFHTGKSLSGNSHCLSCLSPLTWYELFPLFSYLALRGRCRQCLSYIPPRYFVVELATALSFLAIYQLQLPLATMFFYALLAALLLVIAVYDIYHFVIPDELVVLVSIVVGSHFLFQVYSGAPLLSILPQLAAALVAFLFYAGLWKVSAGRWIGFGDAKLAAPLAFMAGLPAVFSMIVLSFWVGAVVSVLLLATQKLLQRGKLSLRIWGSTLTIKSEVPFAPFLIIGFILSALYQVNVLSLIAYVL